MREPRKYHAARIAIRKPANAPGWNQVPGTGIVHTIAMIDHRISGTQTRWIAWFVAFSWSRP